MQYDSNPFQALLSLLYVTFWRWMKRQRQQKNDEKRKEKKKNGGGSGGADSKSVEEKVNRDYQRLAPNYLLFFSCQIT